ncbi:MAG: hypothetical protein KOO62_00765 [candidate division Zixibacteria bacterium]|nr:hypothetical protein [candidate division Zixibacteria bacterium]
MKKTILHKIGRWSLWLVLALFFLFCLQVTVLAFPQLIATNSVQSGTITLYYDGIHDTTIELLAEEVEQRLRASGYYDPNRSDRVYYIRNQTAYNVLARLALVTPLAQGFNLSVLGNSFVCETRVSALASRSGGLPKFSIFEGDPAHTMAHEVGHQYMIDRIGRSMWRRLPHWKQEGFPEYVANIGNIRKDSLATLPHRIAVLNDNHPWGGEYGWDRVHYEAGLLVEFLLDIRHYSIEDIVADSVTLWETHDAMLEWSHTLHQGT